LVLAAGTLHLILTSQVGDGRDGGTKLARGHHLVNNGGAARSPATSICPAQIRWEWLVLVPRLAVPILQSAATTTWSLARPRNTGSARQTGASSASRRCGNRSSNAPMASRASRRASGAPRQKWTPPPND